MEDDIKDKENKEKKDDVHKGKPESSEEKTEEPQLLEEPIKVQDYVYLNLLSLEGKAWAYMDLIAHPETQKHRKDMEQAKLAIDAIDALYKIVENHLTQAQKKDLQSRMTNLRLNFSKK